MKQGCLLDPPCVSCAFGKNIPTSSIMEVLIPQAVYGCKKGGGDVVRTKAGVGLQTPTGIRYLTDAGKEIAVQKGYPDLVRQ